MNIRKLLMLPIILYQYLISPLFPGSCRFKPTCSEYAKLAILKYGVLKGFFLGLKRLSKCHPWGDSGYDPIK
ncbi:MAG: membrane protein insertion efficiency factor YidD [Bacteroidota bacterium]|nr:membrane protein insertion efficiency factor YidD [Bacteroidota bacterium]